MNSRACPLAVKYDSRDENALQESIVTDHFLENPNEHSFAALFSILSPQLLSFFRRRTPELGLAEDLTQDVMLTVYQKCRQVRDRKLFRAWVFKSARNALYEHCGKWARAAATVNIEEVENRLSAASFHSSGIPSFEFRRWMSLLSAQEQDVMNLRFVEEWEYHEIAAARGTPVGTIKWRVSDCKKKIAKHLGYTERAAA
jgi:RNA polymerase sigma-70 factor, ECF subfamily